MARGRKPKNQSQGLGDTIEKITEATGIKSIVKAIAGDDCGCEERKKKLNELLSYRLKVVNCPDETQIKWYFDFMDKRTLTFTDEEKENICLYYSNIFDVIYFKPKFDSKTKPYIKMINELDKVFKNYQN